MSPTQIHIGAAIPASIKSDRKVVTQKHVSRGIFNEINNFLARFTPITITDKVLFFRLLSTMINAGISIVKALHILEDEIKNKHFKSIITEIVNGIETGGSFSQVLSKYPRYFTEAQVGMMEAGEASGRLSQALLQIASETEKSASLTSKVKGAMLYPIVVISILIIATAAIMTLVIPKIKEMFESLGVELPSVTIVLIKTSDFIIGKTLGITNLLWICLVMVTFIFIFLSWKRTYVGRYAWHKMVLGMPIFGTLTQKIVLARFCRGLSTLTNSGVSIIKALRITATSVGNAVYEKRIHQIADDVKRGISMAENMKDDEALFPNMVVGMISVAEQTAQIDSITDKLAHFYEDQVETMIKNLSSLMEPLIIVVLGLSVGFLVVSVMLPILQSSDLATLSS
ncbi:hypothetical protein COY07_03275 [Candidatus Peregrinibacteria bacterium CG_4_10_14_0_2_um_filter_43_11]|nr:MAG: hypothetical protein COY07_03275 [Candidatus Peregrinibacteria bacterium CG_4_10_14_0_2_um_filter_43_11]